MNRRALMLTTLTLLTPPLHAATTVRTLDSEVSLSGATVVEVKVSVGDLAVVGEGGETIKVRAEIQCSTASDADCKEAAERIAIGSRRSGNELVVEVEGFPKLKSKGLSVNARIEIPRALPLSINSGVGDITVAGMIGNLEIDSGVGDVKVTTKSSHLRTIGLDSGVGEVQLQIDGQTIEGAGFVGKGLDWSQGKGAATLEVDTGVGDITVVLE